MQNGDRFRQAETADATERQERGCRLILNFGSATISATEATRAISPRG